MAVCPFAAWRPGPPEKVHGVIAPTGITGHSAVGYRYGLYDVLDSPYVPWGWQFSVFYDGAIEQHYDTTALVWHGHASSEFAIGIEHEGGFSPEDEPLRPAQLASSIRLMQWIGKEHGFPLKRSQPGRTLHEHNEFANKPCPSNRIPWELYEEAEVPAGDATPFVTARESLELQYVLGKGTIAVPRLVTLTDQDYQLFVEGQVGQTVPAGTEVLEWRVFTLKNPPDTWLGKDRS